MIVYDDKSEHFANFIGETYHLKFDIEYLDVNHPKERKLAIMYKTIAGARKDPFIGSYSEEDEIIDALWSEEKQITYDSIKIFFEKYEQRNS